MKHGAVLKRNAVSLFFEGLMLCFIIACCVGGQQTHHTPPDDVLSLSTGAMGDIVMRESASFNGIEQISLKSTDFKLDNTALGGNLTSYLIRAFQFLFINSSAHNIFYIHITASAP